MEFRMGQVFNASEEIERSASYDNIRVRILSFSFSKFYTLAQFFYRQMFKVPRLTSDGPQDDLLETNWTRWHRPADAKKLAEFSAVCFLTAR